MEKNKVWIWRAIDGISRRPLGWELDPRGDASAKKLISRVDLGTYSFATDDWGGFFRLLPEERHFYGKDLTFPIESTNSGLNYRNGANANHNFQNVRIIVQRHLNEYS